MLNSHSPPTSTPLEPCRVVPYMSVPALRGLSLPPGALSAYDRLTLGPFSQSGTAFSAFDSAFINAAHQVINILPYKKKNKFYNECYFSMPLQQFP